MCPETVLRRPRLLFLVTEDWYFWSHRLPVARAAQAAGFDVCVATRVAQHGERIAGEGFRLCPLSWRRRGGGIVGHLRALRDIARILRAEQPDIIHNVALKPVVFGSLAARCFGCARVVNSINGLGFSLTSPRRSARIARRLLWLAFRCGVDRQDSIVILQNEDDERYLSRAGFLTRARRIIVRGSGVDVDRFTAMPEPAGGVPTVAVVTRMLGIKGVDTVVEAGRMLRGRGIDHRLLLVGAPDPGNPSSIAESALRAWAAEPGIEWLGWRQDIREIWAQSHVAALASRGGEGLPKSLLEAAACGRPIVATDVSGCRDVAVHGVNALVVAPGDAAAFADALHTLLADPALRRRYGAAGRQLVETKFAETAIAAATLAIYRALLTAPPDPLHEGDELLDS